MKLTDLEIENILKNLDLSINESCVSAYYNDEKTTLDVNYDFESDEYDEDLWLFGDKENLTTSQQNRVISSMRNYYEEELKANKDAMYIYNQQMDDFLDNLRVVR